MNPRLKLTTLEKIQHMIKLKDALNSKLEMIRNKTLVVPHGHHLANFSGKRGRPAATKHSSYSAAPTTLMSSTKSLLGVQSNEAALSKDLYEEEEVDEDDEEEQVAPTNQKQPRVIGSGARVTMNVKDVKEANTNKK